MIRVGDINRFAVECVFSTEDNSEGKIFIIIESNKYGSKSGEFDLKDFFNNIKTSLSNFNPLLPALYDYSVDDVFKSLDAVWEDTSIEDCPIESAFPGFFDDPSDVTHQIVFYGGDYAFDGISIVLTSNGEKTHLMIRDRDDMRVSDVIIDANEFKGKFFELGDMWEKTRL